MTRQIKDFIIKQKLASGASLEILIFDDEPKTPEHRWLFNYRYIHQPHNLGEDPELINNTSLIVNYADGISKECRLMMGMVFPKRRGKKFIWGVDVSENSMLHIDMLYEKQSSLYKMKTAEFTPGPKIDFDKLDPALVRPVNFPFPIKDRVEQEYEFYKIPFLRSDGKEEFFVFPENYQRTKR